MTPLYLFFLRGCCDTYLTKYARVIDCMEEVRSDQTSVFTDWCRLIARGQGTGISLTKSLFTVDSTQGKFSPTGAPDFHITAQQRK